MSGRMLFRALYFFVYASVGVNLPYLAPYWKGLGFSGAEIGAAQLAYQLVAIPSALAWAAMADRLGAPARALRIATALSALVAGVLVFAKSPLGATAVMAAQGLAGPAIVPLIDGMCVEWLGRSGGKSYARTRLFGSIGYIVAAQGVGVLLTVRGDRAADALVPILICGWLVLLAVTARAVPALPTPTTRPRMEDVRRLLRDPRLLWLLAACSIHWAACSPFHLFFGVFVRDLGLPSSVTGSGMAAGVGAEVLVLFLFPRLEDRFRLRTLFAFSFGASAIRWILMSRATTASALIGLQLFHGLTFGLFWACTMRAMSDLVPSALRTTGQALLTAILFAGGNAIGYALSGWGYDRFHGAASLYAWAAAVEVAPFVIALAASRGRGERIA